MHFCADSEGVCGEGGDRARGADRTAVQERVALTGAGPCGGLLPSTRPHRHELPGTVIVIPSKG